MMVIVAATITGAVYVLQKHSSIYATIMHRLESRPLVNPADLSTGDIDIAAFGCGQERWAVKTLSDADAARAVEGDPQHATVRDLLNLRPPAWSRNSPRFPEEVQYVVEGSILAYKLEPDSDIHVIIGSDHVTMVVEFPRPDCVPRLAARPLLDHARNQLLRILPRLPDSTARQTPQPIPVRIRGVLFFDKSHGQIGGTWNGAELHPVLEITPK
jgi:hypothetical protein